MLVTPSGIVACPDFEKDEGFRASGQDLQAQIPILCPSSVFLQMFTEHAMRPQQGVGSVAEASDLAGWWHCE